MKGGANMGWIMDRKKAELALMKAGMTWQEVAAAAKMSPATITKALKGQKTLSPKTLSKIAGALNVPVEDIVEYVEE